MKERKMRGRRRRRKRRKKTSNNIRNKTSREWILQSRVCVCLIPPDMALFAYDNKLKVLILIKD